MELKLNISNLNEHAAAAKKLIDFAGAERIFLFDAPMGSGKTTFIKSLCTQLGVSKDVSSPTYSIVNEYIANSGLKIFHFDLYRLKSAGELLDIGFEEYLHSGNYVFIEWPELAMPFLDSYMMLIIKTESNNRYLYGRISHE